MNTNGTKRPLPVMTPLTEPFWRAAKGHELVLQRCEKCGAYQWYPKPCCSICLSPDLKWRKASGLGTVYTYTVIRQVVGNKGFEDDVPYIVAEIELDEGPRMYARMPSVNPGENIMEMKVKVGFEDLTDEISIPVFEKRVA